MKKILVTFIFVLLSIPSTAHSSTWNGVGENFIFSSGFTLGINFRGGINCTLIPELGFTIIDAQGFSIKLVIGYHWVSNYKQDSYKPNYFFTQTHIAYKFDDDHRHRSLISIGGGIAFLKNWKNTKTIYAPRFTLRYQNFLVGITANILFPKDEIIKTDLGIYLPAAWPVWISFVKW